MSSCWYGLTGPIVRASGTNGTVTLPAGAKLLRITAYATAASTVQIFNDAAVVTLPASSGWYYQTYEHALVTAPTGHNTILFTSTSSYVVEYSLEGS